MKKLLLFLSLAMLFGTAKSIGQEIETKIENRGDGIFSIDYRVTKSDNGTVERTPIRKTLIDIKFSEGGAAEVIDPKDVDSVAPLGPHPEAYSLWWYVYDMDAVNKMAYSNTVKQSQREAAFGGLTSLRRLVSYPKYIPQFIYSHGLKSVWIVDEYHAHLDTIPDLGRLNVFFPELEEIYSRAGFELPIGGSHWDISVKDSVLYSNDCSEVIWYPTVRKNKVFKYQSYRGPCYVRPYAFSYSSVEQFYFEPLTKGLSISIGVGAFYNSKIQQVHLVKETEEIGDSAFWGCEDLRLIELPTFFPPKAGPNTFSPNVYKNCKLQVPAGAENIYSQFEPWCYFFKDMEKPGGAGVEDINTDSEGAAEYFTLMGVKVEEPVAGQLYICRRGSKAEKVIYRE